VNDTRFVLIRHGESAWNAAGRWQGPGDPPLSPRGREQAVRLADALAGEGIDAIVSSDLLRATETAGILAARLDATVAADPRLRELDVGRWSGRTRAEIEAEDAENLAAFECGDPDARAGGGECRRDVGVRANAAIADIARVHTGRCVAVVAHLGVIRELLPGCDLGNAEWKSVRAADLRRSSRVVAGRVPPAAH
jgi:broad specificity phosphatase PhoE